VVALERARRLRLVEYPCARANELLVELALMVASVPALPVQRLEGAPALRDPVEGGRARRHAPALVERLHGRQHPLRLGRPVRGLVRSVEVAEGQHGSSLARRRIYTEKIDGSALHTPARGRGGVGDGGAYARGVL